VYAVAARYRRAWLAGHPSRVRRLERPVVSVGSLSAGGSGKTPLAGLVARRLLEAGHHPAILSRGYGRTAPDDGVTIVSDGTHLCADLARAGDEPLMLARALPDVPVVVSPDRYLAGRVAELHLGATVHVLDDGFQHLQLDRDIDLVIVGREDVARPVTLPGGRLREPLDTLVAADAVLVEEGVVIESAGLDLPIYSIRRETPPDRGATAAAAAGRPVLAVAGIASPARFFRDLRETGWSVADTMAYRDHHRFTRGDVDRMVTNARKTGAAMIVTTEKDYVRLQPFEPLPVPIGFVPISLRPEPFDRFRAWIGSELETTRGIARG
jgi:tetraacyldisaccharide 4'-kinase